MTDKPKRKRRPFATHRHGQKPISPKKHAAAVKMSAPIAKVETDGDEPYQGNSWLDEVLGEDGK